MSRVGAGRAGPDVLLIGPPDGRRARAFQATLAGLGWPPARTVSYLDVLAGRAALPDLVRPGTVVRLESPGEDLPTERALIERGGGVPTDLAAGEIAPMRAWYAGFSAVLREVEAGLAQAPRTGGCSTATTSWPCLTSPPRTRACTRRACPCRTHCRPCTRWTTCCSPRGNVDGRRCS
ncbi:hypothetical protein [Deinococcus aquaticus]|uniref:hypothetical protein n=1 Tax=Deinococcus aquaticus TaxID=328692 RepID=UPI0036244932